MPSPSLLSRVGLDAASRARRLAFLGFDATDTDNLAALRTFARANVDRIVDDFYRHLMNFEETRRLLASDQEIARLKTLQRAYFLRMFDADFGGDYFESRLRVGAAHAAIDLRPEWYFGTYFLYVRLLTARLQEHYRDDPDVLLPLLSSFVKVVFLDMGLAIDAYIVSGYVERTLAQEYRRMAEVAERALEEKADLEQAKADLTSMIVHDLKGPLAGILAVTQLARRRSGGDAAADRPFAQIQRSAQDLMRMIENLLEIDQMQEGRLELRLEPIDVDALLAECAAEYRAAGELAGIVIATAVEPALPVVMTDRWLLRRVLNNLVVNAIRHSGAQSIDLAARMLDGTLEIRVRDTGRGIPVEERAALFERARRHRGTHREDTGLGLVFCKMAVERMHGTLAIDGTAGGGTTFVIALPADASL